MRRESFNQTPANPINIFAYGSNLSLARMRERIDCARVVQTGYVACRRLAFHKRSVDGSAKANAVFTGRRDDRIWGVVYEMTYEQRLILDEHESLGIGYDLELETVIVSSGTLLAHLYVARDAAIDETLKPYNWYHQFVLHGARQHELPNSYIEALERHDTAIDPDSTRAARNRGLLKNRPTD